MGNKIKTELITDFLKERGMSKTAFCRLCKIGARTLNKILAQDPSVNLIALFKISKATGIRTHEFLE